MDERGPLLDDRSPEVSHAPWESLAGVEDVPPDGTLALVLEEVDITAVDDHLLVETIAAWQRVAAWMVSRYRWPPLPVSQHCTSLRVLAWQFSQAAMNWLSRARLPDPFRFSIPGRAGLPVW